MIEIKVKSHEEAIKEALKFLPTENRMANICFTGGNFGLGVVKKIKDKNVNISNWSIFQTDERFDAAKEDVIQNKLILNLKHCKGYSIDSCNFFGCHSVNGEVSSLLNNLKKLIEVKFDLTFLSLGEDGHIAGHFENSIEIIGGQFCFTDNAPKLPKKRISYKLERLLSSQSIVLACIGERKKEALNNLFSKKYIHHELVHHEGLILIRD